MKTFVFSTQEFYFSIGNRKTISPVHVVHFVRSCIQLMQPIGKQWSKMTRIDQQESSGQKCQKQTNRKTVVTNVKKDQQENSGHKCKKRPIGKQWSKISKIHQKENSGQKCQKYTNRKNSGQKCQKSTNVKTVVKNVKNRPKGTQWSKMSKVDL